MNLHLGHFSRVRILKSGQRILIRSDNGSKERFGRFTLSSLCRNKLDRSFELNQYNQAPHNPLIRMAKPEKSESRFLPLKPLFRIGKTTFSQVPGGTVVSTTISTSGLQ